MRMIQFLDTYRDTAIELRPEISEQSIRSALRLNLAGDIDRPLIREVLILLTEIERLNRQAQLHSAEVNTYRLLLSYRRNQKELSLYEDEQKVLHGYMQTANQAVENHTLSELDFAKSKALSLELDNRILQLKHRNTELKKALALQVGPDAPIEAWAQTLFFNTDQRYALDTLLQSAQQNRHDYLLLKKRLQLNVLKRELAREDNHFHMQHIQPEVEHDLDDHSFTFALSASFHLPWSSPKTTTQVFDYEIAYYRDLITQMEQRLKTEVSSYLMSYRDHLELHQAYKPETIDELEAKWKAIAEESLLRADQLRDVFYLRERILRSRVHYLESERKQHESQLDLMASCGLTP